MITHGHISVAGRRVTVPGMLVEAKDEDAITFEENSPLANELHPIRQALLAPAQRSAEIKETSEESSEEGDVNE